MKTKVIWLPVIYIFGYIITSLCCTGVFSNLFRSNATVVFFFFFPTLLLSIWSSYSFASYNSINWSWIKNINYLCHTTFLVGKYVVRSTVFFYSHLFLYIYSPNRVWSYSFISKIGTKHKLRVSQNMKISKHCLVQS